MGVVERPPPRMRRSDPAPPAVAPAVRPSTSFLSLPGATVPAPELTSELVFYAVQGCGVSFHPVVRAKPRQCCARSSTDRASDYGSEG